MPASSTASPGVAHWIQGCGVGLTHYCERPKPGAFSVLYMGRIDLLPIGAIMIGKDV